MDKLKVIKIGGNVIDNPDALETFLEAFAAVSGPKILVHGGGAIASRTLKNLFMKLGKFPPNNNTTLTINFGNIR